MDKEERKNEKRSLWVVPSRLLRLRCSSLMNTSWSFHALSNDLLSVLVLNYGVSSWSIFRESEYTQRGLIGSQSVHTGFVFHDPYTPTQTDTRLL